jgi:hypothetical protein
METVKPSNYKQDDEPSEKQGALAVQNGHGSAIKLRKKMTNHREHWLHKIMETTKKRTTKPSVTFNQKRIEEPSTVLFDDTVWSSAILLSRVKINLETGLNLSR